MSEQVVLQLKPEQVEVTSNGARFDLNPGRVETLGESILNEGGVLQPVGVVALDKPVNGKTHRLLFGFHRHAAVSQLNEKQGAGLTLPAIVLTRADETAELKTQIEENAQRQEMSPMDKAIAMKNLLDAGVPRGEVRRMFSIPGNLGKKGTSVQPMSNATMNIHLRFLELPKTIQQDIHNGGLSWTAAYALGRVPPEKRQAVLERAKAEVLKQATLEATDEAKYLKVDQKAKDAEAEASKAQQELMAAQQAIADAQQNLADKTAAYREVQKEAGPILTDKKAKEADKKAINEKLKAADADVKAAEKLVKQAKAAIDKTEKKAQTASEKAAEVKAQLEAQRKALKNKPKAVGPAEVNKAAAAEGAGAVALGIRDVRDLLRDGAKQEKYPRTQRVFSIIRACTDGIGTSKECIEAVAVALGEAQAPKPVVPAPAPAKAKK